MGINIVGNIFHTWNKHFELPIGFRGRQVMILRCGKTGRYYKNKVIGFTFVEANYKLFVWLFKNKFIGFRIADYMAVNPPRTQRLIANSIKQRFAIVGPNNGLDFINFYRQISSIGKVADA